MNTIIPVGGGIKERAISGQETPYRLSGASTSITSVASLVSAIKVCPCLGLQEDKLMRLHPSDSAGGNARDQGTCEVMFTTTEYFSM